MEKAEQRREAKARRKWQNPTFQVRLMGNRWYVIQWPAGAILTAHPTEAEARETCAKWVSQAA